MIEISGADRILSLNLHSYDLCGFSKIPVINIDFENIIFEVFKNEYADCPDFMIIAPDSGSCKKCTDIMKKYTVNGAFIHKGTI